MDDIPREELVYQAYGPPHFRCQATVASMGMIDESAATSIGVVGPDVSGAWDCPGNEWLQPQTTAVLAPSAHELVHDTYVLSTLGPSGSISTYVSDNFPEPIFPGMAATPINTPPTIQAPYSRESGPHSHEFAQLDSSTLETWPTRQATPAAVVAIIPPAAAGRNDIIDSSVDDQSTNELHRRTTTPPHASTSDTGAATRRGSGITVELRGTRRRASLQKLSAGGDADGAAADHQTELATGMEARMKHQRVEKKYRNRLNSQFERLLAALPCEVFTEGRVEADGVVNDEKGDEGSLRNSKMARVTKAEVLEVAARLIADCNCKEHRGTRDGTSRAAC